MSLRLLAWLGLDSSDYNAKLGAATAKAESFGEKLGNILKGGPGGLLAGGASALGLGVAFMEANKMIDDLKARAKGIQIGSSRMNLDTDTFQRVQNVADSKNSSTEEVASAFDHLAQAQDKFKSGTPEETEKLAKAFSALGIASASILKNDYRKLFFDIADGVKNSELSAEKIAALKELFGKGGTGLIPSMKTGFDGRLANSDHLSDDDLTALKKMNEASRDSGELWRELGQSASIALTKVSAGIKSLPASFLTIFGAGGGATSSDGTNRYITEKLTKRMQAIVAEKTAQEQADRTHHTATKEEEASAARAKSNAEQAKRLKAELNATDRKGFLETQAKEDKLKFLAEERRKILEGIKDIDAGFKRGGAGADPEGVMGVNRMTLLLALSKNKNEAAEISRPHVSAREHMDGLARIGGFSGNADRGMEKLQNQIVANTKVIATATVQIAQQTSP